VAASRLHLLRRPRPPPVPAAASCTLDHCNALNSSKSIHPKSIKSIQSMTHQAQGVKAVVTGQGAVQVLGQLRSGEPAGAVGRGGLRCVETG